MCLTDFFAVLNVLKLTRQKTRQPLVLIDTPGRAFDKIALDLLGPLSATDKDNKYILTFQDLLTKYSLAVPLQNANAVETADAPVNHFISRLEAPKIILIDQAVISLAP